MEYNSFFLIQVWLWSIHCYFRPVSMTRRAGYNALAAAHGLMWPPNVLNSSQKYADFI